MPAATVNALLLLLRRCSGCMVRTWRCRKSRTPPGWGVERYTGISPTGLR